MAPVTSARGLAETDSSEGGAAAENQTELLKHEWHHSRGTSARRADRVHNPGTSKTHVAMCAEIMLQLFNDGVPGSWLLQKPKRMNGSSGATKKNGPPL